MTTRHIIFNHQKSKAKEKYQKSEEEGKTILPIEDHG